MPGEVFTTYAKGKPSALSKTRDGLPVQTISHHVVASAAESGLPSSIQAVPQRASSGTADLPVEEIAAFHHMSQRGRPAQLQSAVARERPWQPGH